MTTTYVVLPPEGGSELAAYHLAGRWWIREWGYSARDGAEWDIKRPAGPQEAAWLDRHPGRRAATRAERQDFLRATTTRYGTGRW